MKLTPMNVGTMEPIPIDVGTMETIPINVGKIEPIPIDSVLMNVFIFKVRKICHFFHTSFSFFF